MKALGITRRRFNRTVRLQPLSMFNMKANIQLLQIEFREFCSQNLTLRSINDVFSKAGFQKADLDSYPSGERRSLVMRYYESEDWKSIETVQKFLNVLKNTLMISFIEEDQKNHLRELCRKAGFEVDSNGYKIHLTGKGVGEEAKNIIFSADGPKPEIILSDSISNDIEIVKNAEYCLVYNRPIHTHGLLWQELIDWWKNISNEESLPNLQASRNLYSRLGKSLSSPPEKLFWKMYFELFYENLGDKLPALIPQVYLHYDPYTIRQLGGERRVVRQRMDFLFLLSDRIRVIIEIDGKQHYSDKNVASPKLYSEMVAEDRKLSLLGYEIYRFGGYEFNSESQAKEMTKEFIENLFQKHAIIPKVT